MKLAELWGSRHITKTCEMAMSEAVKKNYESTLNLVDETLA